VTNITDTEENGIAVSTIEEVRAAETKVQKVLDALKKADARDANDLSAGLSAPS
jgi:hypothetical protein